MGHRVHRHENSSYLSPVSEHHTGHGDKEYSTYQYAYKGERGDENNIYGDSDPSRPQTPRPSTPANPPTREPWGRGRPLEQPAMMSAHEISPLHYPSNSMQIWQSQLTTPAFSDSSQDQQNTSRHNAYPSPETPWGNGENSRRQGGSRHGGLARRGASFFTPGRIFVVCWFQTAARNATSASGNSELIQGRHGQKAHGTLRRMVVIRTRPGQNSSTCVGIYTYSGRGLAKPGLDLRHHAILFDETEGKPYTEPNEPQLQRSALAVRIDSPEERLDPMSRINFGKLHTVEHNLDVGNVGCISGSSMALFNAYVNEALTW